MSDLMLPVGVAFASFCIWLGVRIVNQRKYRVSQALILVPILYVATFGPAFWLHQRRFLSDEFVIDLYRPILQLVSDCRLPQPLAWYASLGARDQAEVRIESFRIVWSNDCKSGLTYFGSGRPSWWW